MHIQQTNGSAFEFVGHNGHGFAKLLCLFQCLVVNKRFSVLVCPIEVLASHNLIQKTLICLPSSQRRAYRLFVAVVARGCYRGIFEIGGGWIGYVSIWIWEAIHLDHGPFGIGQFQLLVVIRSYGLVSRGSSLKRSPCLQASFQFIICL